MAKEDYFEVLEALGGITLGLIKNTFAKQNARDTGELRKEFDKIKCTVETRLFSDFVPPIQREDIARVLHCLSRVADSAYFMAISSRNDMILLKTGRGDLRQICLSLAQRLQNTVLLFKKLRLPSCIPEIDKYRTELLLGQEVLSELALRVRGGALPRYAHNDILAARELLLALSDCFDCLVEVMLNNI